MNFRTRIDVDVYDAFAMIVKGFGFDIYSWLNQSRIADAADEIFNHCRNGFFRDANHISRILNTQEYITAKAVKKGTYGFISVAFYAIAAAFELDTYSPPISNISLNLSCSIRVYIPDF
jgi:hypothetical protein